MRKESAQIGRLVAIIDRLARLFTNRDLIEADGVTATLPQVALLEMVERDPGCRFSELADRLGVTLPTISVAVHRLEDVGMLRLRPDPQDGRSTLTDLTELGKRMVREARSYRFHRLSTLMDGLSHDELETLVGLLERAVSTAEAAHVRNRASMKEDTGE
jgi:DNA-binding MarR family transcriptional regulator